MEGKLQLECKIKKIKGEKRKSLELGHRVKKKITEIM